MRLFLLPISTRRTLLYCQRINVQVSEQQTLIDKGTRRAAKLWSDWEKKESGWQKKIVDLGNRALKRIPYEEWGLKSIPPLSARRKEDELSGKEEVQVFFPPTLIPEETMPQVLKTLGTEREALHRSRMIYSFLGMPLVAPIALIPV
jgi:Mitochondrial K+-H+ exchange-related